MSIEKFYSIYRVPEFKDWFNLQTEKTQIQIDDRLSKIQDYGYFGDHKFVNDDKTVWELKWKNGRRIYFAFIPEKSILVMLGGNKNGQNKDIHQAETIYKKYSS